MKVLVPEIATHVMENGGGLNQEMLSLDVHPNEPIMVSAGAGENRVIFWQVQDSSQQISDWLSFSFELATMALENVVNILRFSPCGTYLACGDSSGLITIFSVRETGKAWGDIKEERDLRRVFLRGHIMDVQDFAWSPNSLMAVSAGTDNVVIVWDAVSCKDIQRLKNHTHYAQGVAWSGDGKFIASASLDETVRIYSVTAKPRSTIVQEISVLKKPRLFADEFRVPSFFRRLAFSPEPWSRLLIVPGGLTRQGQCDGEKERPTLEAPVEADEAKKTLVHAAHIFRFGTDGLSDTLPIATLTGFDKPSLSVRFHPRCFDPLGGTFEADIVEAGQGRYVYAVATLDAILVYDTQHAHPISVATKFHYASYTDLAWHVDDKSGTSTLFASSRDGCFSIIRFSAEELGIMRPRPQPSIAACKPVEAQEIARLDEGEAKHVGAISNENTPTEANNDVVVDETTTLSNASSASKKRRVQLETVRPTIEVVTASQAATVSPDQKPVTVLQVKRRVMVTTTTNVSS